MTRSAEARARLPVPASFTADTFLVLTADICFAAVLGGLVAADDFLAGVMLQVTTGVDLAPAVESVRPREGGPAAFTAVAAIAFLVLPAVVLDAVRAVLVVGALGGD